MGVIPVQRDARRLDDLSVRFGASTTGEPHVMTCEYVGL